MIAIGAAGAAGCGSPADDSSPADSASSTLDSLLEGAWNRRLADDPLARLREGLAVERLPDIGFTAADERALLDGELFDALRAIDPAALEQTERVTLETAMWETAMAVEGHRFFWLRSRLTPYSAQVRLYDDLFPGLPLRDGDDLDRYVALVEQVPGHILQLHDLTRGQLERGIVVSSHNLPAAVGLVRAHAQRPDAGAFALADQRVAGLDPAAVATARARIARLVADSIRPALAELATFLDGPYAERAPATVGISSYPEGRDYYEYLTRLHTTMDVTPEEVQRAGTELLAEFRARMAEIRDRLGWEGTAEDFHALLRTDPRYFPRGPDEVAARLRAASERMAGRVSDYFDRAPTAPWDAIRLAPELEPAMTYGFYSPPTSTEPSGFYHYNGSRLHERSWLGLTAISLHELIPGHHFQIARTLEDGSLPVHRRNSFYTAFSEGWGSYASLLGLDAGIYEDPYSEYGLYILESFLATRLVVDPGMNYFGMSLEDARAFMRENTLESDTQITTESLRYSTDIPGQALAYQMGKRRLLELRSRARARLGDRFDIRAFHEAILENGSLPMVVLERQVDAWLDLVAR